MTVAIAGDRGPGIVLRVQRNRHVTVRAEVLTTTPGVYEWNPDRQR